MGKIIAIIATMLGIVIGANTIAPIQQPLGVSIMNLTAGYSQAVISLSALLPLMFVVVIMVFAVKGIGD